jgi:hypothetical protein
MKTEERDSEKYIKYTGNRLINLNVILFAGCLVYTIGTFTVDYLYVYIFFNVIFFGYVAVSANYFMLSDNYLKVKNFLWFWKEKTYPLNDIKGIDIIRTRRSSTFARIIQQDNTSKQYKAGSLREKDWINLYNDLASRGVKVQSVII